MAYKKKTSSKKEDAIKPSLDLFMILGNILVDKDMTLYEHHIHSELFASTFSTYMIMRYLSMNQNSMVRSIALKYLDVIENMADKPELVYKLLINVVPKTYNRFTPYIKSGFNTKKS